MKHLFKQPQDANIRWLYNVEIRDPKKDEQNNKGSDNLTEGQEALVLAKNTKRSTERSSSAREHCQAHEALAGNAAAKMIEDCGDDDPTTKLEEIARAVPDNYKKLASPDRGGLTEVRAASQEFFTTNFGGENPNALAQSYENSPANTVQA